MRNCEDPPPVFPTANQSSGAKQTLLSFDKLANSVDRPPFPVTKASTPATNCVALVQRPSGLDSSGSSVSDPCSDAQSPDSMRRRSSGSTEEDPTDAGVLADVPPFDDDERDHSLTTSKFDVTRHSDTLDRRKVEKALSAAPLTQDAWTAEPGTYGDLRRREYPLDHKLRLTLEGKMSEQKDWRRSRIRSPWRGSIATTVVTALSVLFLYCVVRSVLTRQRDPKGCNMSYMSPMFAKLSDFDTEHTRFASKYSLYLYREEGIDEDTMVGEYSARTRKRK